MGTPITLDDLPEDLARFVEAQIASGRFTTLEDVLRACVHALEHQNAGSARRDANENLRRLVEDDFKAFDRGDCIETTPDELMDGIEAELGLRREGG